MPTYILLSSLTPEGSQTLHKDPERLDAVNKESSEFGCKVVTQYAVLGGYDFVTIVDAPDNETVAHMSVDLSSRGTVRSRRSLRYRSLSSRPSSRAPNRWVSADPTACRAVRLLNFALER